MLNLLNVICQIHLNKVGKYYIFKMFNKLKLFLKTLFQLCVYVCVCVLSYDI